MTTHTSPWAAGTPCWVDLSATNPADIRDFYTGLFGWKYELTAEEFGGYGIATFNGHHVAGIGNKQDPSQPSSWITYLATHNADTSAAQIIGAGGNVIVPAMDVGSMGRMLIATDTVGAAFGMWQARDMIGAQLVNEAGGFVWNEQLSRDVPASVTFYSALGLTAEPLPDDSLIYFTMNASDDYMVAGVGEIPDELPQETPAQWLTYFATVDTDATTARVVELGGQVVDAPQDTPYGRLVVFAGLEGEWFAAMSVASGGETYRESDLA
ncbi:MAG: VOC family protein [Actinomycetota bacterium]